jgi:hypothetical protein
MTLIPIQNIEELRSKTNVKMIFREPGKSDTDLGIFIDAVAKLDRKDYFLVTFRGGPFPTIKLEIPKTKLNTLYYESNDKSVATTIAVPIAEESSPGEHIASTNVKPAPPTTIPPTTIPPTTTLTAPQPLQSQQQHQPLHPQPQSQSQSQSQPQSQQQLQLQPQSQSHPQSQQQLQLQPQLEPTITNEGLLTKRSGEQLQLNKGKCYTMDRSEIKGESKAIIKLRMWTFPKHGIVYFVWQDNSSWSNYTRRENIDQRHFNMFDSLEETESPEKKKSKY